MKKELKRLIEELDRADEDRDSLDGLLLADILWLAHFDYKAQTKVEQRSKKGFFSWFKEWYSSFGKNKSPNQEDIKQNNQDKTPTDVDIETLSGVPLTIHNNSTAKQEPIKIPKKREFFVTDSLIKSLLPLKKGHISSHYTHKLDEEATVEYIARSSVTIPHFEQELENYYDLYLMVDSNKSMEIWRETIESFVSRLRMHNIFRNLKVLYLDSSKPKLYSNISQTTPHTMKLSNYEKRSLLFIMSDFVSPAWHQNSLLSMVYEYNKKIPTTLINMLPQRMWRGTALGNANITRVHNSRDYPLNHTIDSDADDMLLSMDEEYFKGNVLKVPVVNLDEEDFDSLSSFILGATNNLTSGIVANQEEIEYRDSDTNREMSTQERVDRFFENSSWEAHQLALHISISTHLNLAIIKMIQHNMLPNSKQIHLAEVFVGGLLKKSSDGRYYNFIADSDEVSVRDILLDMLGNYKAMATMYKNSEFIAQNIGSSLDFTALLHTDFQEDDEWSSADEAFAYMVSSTLSKIGGNYSNIVSKLTKKIAKEDTKTKTHTPKTKSFLMGSNERDNEKPIHKVTINYDFEIAQYPVTFEEYDLYCEVQKIDKPSDKGWGRGKRPVINVSWNDAQAYIKWLNEQTGENYRLPTEAEWEYSARAGTTTKWSFGDDEDKLKEYAWYDDTDREKTEPVGKLKPNPWGLYDMYGNVWEWCQDDWVDSYEKTPRDGKAYEDTSLDRKVLRGGSWINNDFLTRSSYRGRGYPTNCINYVGFRLLRTLP